MAGRDSALAVAVNLTFVGKTNTLPIASVPLAVWVHWQFARKGVIGMSKIATDEEIRRQILALYAAARGIGDQTPDGVNTLVALWLYHGIEQGADGFAWYPGQVEFLKKGSPMSLKGVAPLFLNHTNNPHPGDFFSFLGTAFQQREYFAELFAPPGLLLVKIPKAIHEQLQQFAQQREKNPYRGRNSDYLYMELLCNALGLPNPRESLSALVMIEDRDRSSQWVQTLAKIFPRVCVSTISDVEQARALLTEQSARMVVFDGGVLRGSIVSSWYEFCREIEQRYRSRRKLVPDFDRERGLRDLRYCLYRMDPGEKCVLIAQGKTSERSKSDDRGLHTPPPNE